MGGSLYGTVNRKQEVDSRCLGCRELIAWELIAWRFLSALKLCHSATVVRYNKIKFTCSM